MRNILFRNDPLFMDSNAGDYREGLKLEVSDPGRALFHYSKCFRTIPPKITTYYFSHAAKYTTIIFVSIVLFAGPLMRENFSPNPIVNYFLEVLLLFMVSGLLCLLPVLFILVLPGILIWAPKALPGPFVYASLAEMGAVRCNYRLKDEKNLNVFAMSLLKNPMPCFSAAGKAVMAMMRNEPQMFFYYLNEANMMVWRKGPVGRSRMEFLAALNMLKDVSGFPPVPQVPRSVPVQPFWPVYPYGHPYPHPYRLPHQAPHQASGYVPYQGSHRVPQRPPHRIPPAYMQQSADAVPGRTGPAIRHPGPSVSPRDSPSYASTQHKPSYASVQHRPSYASPRHTPPRPVTAAPSYAISTMRRMGQTVEVPREYEYVRGFVRFKMTVVNPSSYPITDLGIELLYDRKAFRLEGIEPDYEMQGTRVRLDPVPPGDRRTVAFYLDPQVCTDSVIDAIVHFRDPRGEMHTITMKSLEVDVICPVLSPGKQVSTAMLKNLVENELEHQDNKLFLIHQGLSPEGAFAMATAAPAARGMEKVWEFTKHDPFYGECWFHGVTGVKKKPAVIRTAVDEQLKVIEVFAAASEANALTGLLTELGHDISRKLEESGRRPVQITNVKVKDRVIHRSSLLFPGRGDEDSREEFQSILFSDAG